MLDIMRVKAGAVDLTVSVKLTSTYFKAKRPRNTVENLEYVSSVTIVSNSNHVTCTFYSPQTTNQ